MKIRSLFELYICEIKKYSDEAVNCYLIVDRLVIFNIFAEVNKWEPHVILTIQTAASLLFIFMLGYSNFIPRRKQVNEREAKATSKTCIVRMTQNIAALPSPGHGPLCRLTFREVISSKAHHLKPVRALVAPAISLITGYMKVTG